jgi:hypothetical protein
LRNWKRQTNLIWHLPDQICHVLRNGGWGGNRRRIGRREALSWLSKVAVVCAEELRDNVEKSHCCPIRTSLMIELSEIGKASLRKEGRQPYQYRLHLLDRQVVWQGQR